MSARRLALASTSSSGIWGCQHSDLPRPGVFHKHLSDANDLERKDNEIPCAKDYGEGKYHRRHCVEGSAVATAPVKATGEAQGVFRPLCITILQQLSGQGIDARARERNETITWSVHAGA